MFELENNKMLEHILQAANRHPNSRVSKLIHSVEEERSQKNIVLLLIELAEHAEYATDFSISLKYYLELFEQLGIGREIILNEAGLLLLNSSKVYARRVDFVQELVERQILTLTNADKEVETNRNENLSIISADKPKRHRKRLVAPVNDPYEVELIPRKFRKLTEEKRFLCGKFLEQYKMHTTKLLRIETELFIHPAAWRHASIADLENEEEVDSKRNYKLFTYHVEHRYNTLVPDINFRLHFKVKDYIDEEEERLEATAEYSNNSLNVLSDWPPLSEEYVKKYLDLENKVLAIGEVKKSKSLRLDYEENDAVFSEVVQNPKLSPEFYEERNRNSLKTSSEMKEIFSENDTIDFMKASVIDITSNLRELAGNDHSETTINNQLDISSENFTDQSSFNQSQNSNSTVQSNLTLTNNSDSLVNASAISLQRSMTDLNSFENDISSNNVSEREVNTNSAEKDDNDNGMGESLTDPNNTNNRSIDLLVEQSIPSALINEASLDLRSIIMADERKGENDENEINLNKIRVYLPHLDDEGVYFSDLDDLEYRMLSPRVVTTDVFPSIPNKENITITVDDEIRSILNLADDEPPPTYILPVQIQPSTPPLQLNIFKFHEKILRRRLLFKLGPEMELFLQSCSMKKANCSDGAGRQYRPMKLFNDSPDATPNKRYAMIDNIASDTEDIEDFLGFTEEEQGSKISHRFKMFYDSNDNMGSDTEDIEDFLGFTEEEQASKISHRLSRDSGVDADTLITTNNIETTNEESAKEVHSVLSLTEVEKLSEKQTEPIYDKNSISSIATDITIAATKSSIDGVISDTDISGSYTNNNNFKNIEKEQDFNNSKTKIQKWHEYLQPILAKARDRHHFDVFQLGTEIINELQKPIISGTSITFQDVMTTKEESYVSRYFLSTLLLANQNNIKIEVKDKCTDKPLAWRDININLLNTQRHTVAIEDNIGIINSKMPKDTIKAMLNNDKSVIKSDYGLNAKLPIKVAVSNEMMNVNLNIIRPLKQIEKLPNSHDDYDSGIFSTEEFSS